MRRKLIQLYFGYVIINNWNYSNHENRDVAQGQTVPKQYTQGNSNFLAGLCDGWGHCEGSLAGPGDQAAPYPLEKVNVRVFVGPSSVHSASLSGGATLGQRTCSSLPAASSGWLVAWAGPNPECDWGSALLGTQGSGLCCWMHLPGDRPGAHEGTECQTSLEGYLWTLWGAQRCVGCVWSYSGRWNCAPLAPIIFRISSSSLGVNI